MKEVNAYEGSHRPISLTSTVAKILERILCDELMLRCNNLNDCPSTWLHTCHSLALSLNQSFRSDDLYILILRRLTLLKLLLKLYN